MVPLMAAKWGWQCGVRLDRRAGFRMADCVVGALPWHGGAPTVVGRRSGNTSRTASRSPSPRTCRFRRCSGTGRLWAFALRETPDRSDLVVLPVLAAEVPRTGTRHSRHGADSVFDDCLHRGGFRLGHRRLHVVVAHQARVDGERRAQDDHGYLRGHRSVGDHREPDAKRVARRWPDRPSPPRAIKPGRLTCSRCRRTCSRDTRSEPSSASAGFAGGIGGILIAEVAGRVLQRDPSFYLPMFVVAGVIYLVALGGHSPARAPTRARHFGGSRHESRYQRHRNRRRRRRT